MLVSMVPIIELRADCPSAWPWACPITWPSRRRPGESDPRPVYYRLPSAGSFELMRKYLPRLNGLVDRLEQKAHLKGQKVQKYQYIGLWLFVAIPLPGTGAWTGLLAAAFLGMRLKRPC